MGLLTEKAAILYSQPQPESSRELVIQKDVKNPYLIPDGKEGG